MYNRPNREVPWPIVEAHDRFGVRSSGAPPQTVSYQPALESPEQQALRARADRSEVPASGRFIASP